MVLLNDKALTVVNLAKERLGEPYVFGALGEACTPANRKRRARDAYPTIVSKCQVLNKSAASCAGCAWAGKQIYDCRGFTYWLLKQVGIIIFSVGATTQYNTTSSWMERGEIADMPNVVCPVFKKVDNKMSHTGMHIGDGTIIHCSGTVKYGKTSDRGWTHYAIPKELYTQEEIDQAERVKKMRTLRNGSTGQDVQAMQELLNNLGFDCGTADGVFGTKTQAAVERFQMKYGLTVDGVAGEKTLTQLAIVTATIETPVNPPESVSDAVSPKMNILLEVDEETARKFLIALQTALGGAA